MLGAVADARGRQHGRRRRLHQIASRLRAELGDLYIYLLLGAASMRPANFYENQIAIPDIREALDNVESLLDKLEPI